jgi:hypothetical protein
MYTHALHRLPYSVKRAQDSVCVCAFLCVCVSIGRLPVFYMQRGVSCMYRTLFDM